jgi:FkbM family methyltransferase
MKEMHFTFDNYTTGNIYERLGCTVEKGDTIVDVGANIGAFANYAYHKGAEKIYCFEPADIAFECLVRNKPEGAETFKSAVGNRYGMVKITLPSADDTMSGSSFIDKGVSNYCPIIPIDFLFSQGVLEKIDFLKIDCEGAELDVIDGISEENLAKISKIALEFHANYLTEEDSEKIIQRLTNAGFKSFQLFLGNGELRIYNFWRG